MGQILQFQIAIIITKNRDSKCCLCKWAPSSNWKSNYVTYTVEDLDGNVSIFSDDELYVSYYNASGFATSGGFYSGFSSPPEKPEINDGSVFGFVLQPFSTGRKYG